MRTLIVVISSIGLVGLLAWLLNSSAGTGKPRFVDSAALRSGAQKSEAMKSEIGRSGLGPSRLHVYCAASNRAVMGHICKQYEELTGTRVELDFGPSQTLLARLELAGEGDIYLPADDSFLDEAIERELVGETLVIATMQVGLAVKKGNPLAITSLSQLTLGRYRFVQANPEAAAVAKLTKQVLDEAGIWEEIEYNTTAFRGSVTEVASSIEVGAADVGVVYDAAIFPFKKLEFVHVKELESATSIVALGILNSARDRDRARHFARYVTAQDKGLLLYKQHGFKVVGGDLWIEDNE